MRDRGKFNMCHFAILAEGRGVMPVPESRPQTEITLRIFRMSSERLNPGRV